MLQSIHDKSKGWLAYVVVGFITIPFVFWGINEYLGGGDALLVADVNGKEITTQQYQRALQQRKQQLREMLGGSIPDEVLEGPQVKQEVLSSLIRDELLRQFADNNGFQVSDAQLAAEIQKLPIFQENGRFSARRYSQLLEAQRISKPAFEQNLRAGMRLEQFQNAVVSSEFLTSKELRAYLQLKAQQRKLSYALVSAEALAETLTLSEEDIQSYYDAHKAEYMSEEQVKLAYIELDPKAVEAGVSVSDEEAKAFYELEKERFKTPEGREARQILVKAGEGAHTDEEAKSLADAAYERLQAGEDFAAVAASASEDSLSASNGGSLGVIYPGDLGKALEDVIFSLEPGEVSEPVKTRLGYAILKLDTVKPAEPKTFAQVQSEIELELRKRKADTLISEMSDQLTTLSYESPQSLAEAADAIGAEIKESAYLGRQSGGEGILSEPNVRRAAFSEDVLINGNNSDVLTLGDGRELVLRVIEHKEARIQSLDDVRPLVESALRQEKLKTLAEERGVKLLEAAKAQGDLGAVAAQYGATYQDAAVVGRDSKDIPSELLARAFKMKHPNEVAPVIFSGVTLNNGDYGVVQLTEVIIPEVSLDDAYAKQSAKALEGNYARRAFDAVYAAMAAEAEIKVFNENL